MAKSLAGSLSDGFIQFSILTRHFFDRFFQNDIVDFEDQMKEKVIGGLAFLAILGVQVANAILFKYPFLEEEGPSWVDKCFFLWVFMLLLGFLTVVEWDVIFPDRRDYLNIIPLPVRVRTFFLAKSASFFLLIGLYSLAVHVPASFSFGYFLSRFHSSSPLGILRYMAAHVVAGSAANVFLFFLCVFIQGLLMSLFSYGLYKKLSLLIRFVLLTAIAFLLIVSLTESVTIPGSFADLAAMKDAKDPTLLFFPPLWFTGLYEYLLGSRDPFFATLIRLALVSVLASVLAFFAAAAVSYSRHLKRSLEVRRGRHDLGRLKSLLSRGFNFVFLRNPTQRAVFHFFGQTLARSTIHKMRLFNYLSVSSALALIMLSTTQLLRSHMSVSNRTLLAIPLVLSFFLLLGIRTLANVPANLEANWVFQLTERTPRRHYYAGVRKVVLFEVLFPLFVLVYAFHYFLWGWKPALQHALFGLAASVVLLEAFFLHFPKIPFTCTYVPGKAKVHVYWLPYVIGFYLYVSLLSTLERFLFASPRHYVNYFVICAIIFAGLRIYENVSIYRAQPFVFEEEPEPVMISLESPP